MTNNIIRSPKVFTIGRPHVLVDEVESFFAAEDIDVGDEKSPAHRILNDLRNAPAINNGSILAEIGGRRCYDSYSAGRLPAEYHSNIVTERHGSVYGHGMYTFAINGVSRSLTHELARHQQGIGFSQQSQRYVKASDINFIMPPMLLYVEKTETPEGKAMVDRWYNSCLSDVITYEAQRLDYEKFLKSHFPNMTPRMRRKRAAEAARSSLPNAAETRLIWSTNLRAARHIIDMRASEFADAEIQNLVGNFIYPILRAYEDSVFQDFHETPVLDDIINKQTVSAIGGI